MLLHTYGIEDVKTVKPFEGGTKEETEVNSEVIILSKIPPDIETKETSAKGFLPIRS